MSHRMTDVTCQHEANAEVDALRRAVDAASDIRLADKLGVERSTISKWRRRGLPLRYRFMIDPAHSDSVRIGMKKRDRRRLYGDGQGEFLMRAALAVVPAKLFDFPELSPALLGDYRESLLVNVVSAILDVSQTVLGKPHPSSEEEYDELLSALEMPDSIRRLRNALDKAALGDR